jgi:hypothetical protein
MPRLLPSRRQRGLKRLFPFFPLRFPATPDATPIKKGNF